MFGQTEICGYFHLDHLDDIAYVVRFSKQHYIMVLNHGQKQELMREA
jgi:hypothetical protein